MSCISGTFIETPALIRKRSSNNREKMAENVEAGLRFARLRINYFSKATFTIWLLKKKGQLNSV